MRRFSTQQLIRLTVGQLTWLRTVEQPNVKQQNLSLWSARHRTHGRKSWKQHRSSRGTTHDDDAILLHVENADKRLSKSIDSQAGVEEVQLD